MGFILAIASIFSASPALAHHTREHLRAHHGGQNFYYVELERSEYQTNAGDPLFLWDWQGWYGGDRNKLWLKTEGEYDFRSREFEDAEVQALWSRAIGGFFDAQFGFRHDFASGLRRDLTPPGIREDNQRNYAVIGLQGLSPYLFEIDAAAFISGKGDFSARIEAEYELLITQRIVLQPRMELNFAAQSVPEYGVGSGLSTAELGARLRYRITPQFAPYLGVSWERSVGETADYVRADGDDAASTSFVAGFRTWF